MQKETLPARLEGLAARIFKDEGCLLSFAGTDADFEGYAAEAPLGSGPSGACDGPRLAVPEPRDRREAFVVPADVTYSALVSDRWSAPGASRLTGSWMVASKALSYDYLWNEVRVVGCAYGVGFSTTRTGASSFSSFRDPRVAETLDRFRASSGWLSGFRPSEEEFEGYVVSTAASFDKPLKPRELVRRQATMHMTGYGRQEFLRRRQEVLDTRACDVRALAPALDEMCEAGCVCVVGNRDIIEQSGTDLNVVDLLAL